MKVLSRYFTRLGILIPLILLSTIITGYENPNQPEKEKPVISLEESNLSIVTPDWVKNAVFYQISPDRFAKSPITKHEKGIQFWK